MIPSTGQIPVLILYHDKYVCIGLLKDVFLHSYLAGYEFKSCLLIDLFQCLHEYLVLHISEINSGENIFDQSIKARAISKRQLGHGVQSQCLHHQTTFQNYMEMKEIDLIYISIQNSIDMSNNLMQK